MNTLREALADWTDFDLSAHALAQALGVFSAATPMRAVKGVYWSDNPLGSALHDILEQLARAGVLEKRDEPDVQYRWRTSRGVDREDA